MKIHQPVSEKRDDKVEILMFSEIRLERNITYNLKNHQPSDPPFLFLLETQFPIPEIRSLT